MLGALLRPTDALMTTGALELAVLAPLDGTDSADEAYEVALAFARRLVVRPGSGAGFVSCVGGVVHLAGATQPSGVAPGAPGDDVDATLTLARRLAGEARGRSSGVVVVLDGDGEATLGQALDQAIDAGELRLHLQPVIGLQDGRRHGFEALLRWQRPGHGLLAPETFLDAAATGDLLVPIGSWVLDHAVGELARLTAAGSVGADEEIGVNVVAAQLRAPGFVEEVAAVLGRHGVAAGRLVLEITEQSLLDDGPATSTALRELTALGIPLAIDDFGTGWSSLALLRRVPARIIKVDQGFVASLGSSSPDPAVARDAAIVRAILGLAHDLGMTSVAEGIDRPEQVAWLRAHGCDRGQGWHLGLPEPPDRVRPAR